MVKRLQHTELLSVYLQSLSTNNYIIMKKRDTYLFAAVLSLACATPSEACTGITLKTADGNTVVARTIEWNGNDLNSRLIVVPRKHKQNAITPSGKKEGMTVEAKYGYVGMAVEMEEFVVEGINEAGLSAGLFYFPKYGKYEQYDPRHKSMSVGDLQLVPWILGNFKTIDEMKTAIAKIHIVTIDSRASTAHWRIIDSSGRQVVLEITDGKPAFYENTLGVLTNAPGFEWHMTNLNNYINLFPGTVKSKYLGETELNSTGAGSGLLGLPGDFTPPSRFIRAAYFQTTAPRQATVEKTITQCFHILNNFDVPIGTESEHNVTPPDIPSATQWTAATDINGRKIYYRTMYNSDIHCIDLNKIDFVRTKYHSAPLDKQKEQHFVTVDIR